MEFSSADGAAVGAFYEDLYQAHFTFAPEILAPARDTIARDLSALGLASAADLIVCNVGTGREAIVFCELGAAQVWHYDLGAASVSALQRFILAKPEFAVLRSEQRDICGEQPFARPGWNLVYLNGVIHHLWNPDVALRSILEQVPAGGRLFLRFYRSGTWLFFIVEFLRRCIDPGSRAFIEAAARERLEVSTDRWFVNDLLDDLYVPVIRFLRPRDVDEYVATFGFRRLTAVPRDDYDHSCNADPCCGIAWERASVKMPSPRRRFPASVSQFDDVRYGEPFINESVGRLRALEGFLATLDERRRAELIAAIYQCARDATGSSEARHIRLGRLVDSGGAPFSGSPPPRTLRG